MKNIGNHKEELDGGGRGRCRHGQREALVRTGVAKLEV